MSGRVGLIEQLLMASISPSTMKSGSIAGGDGAGATGYGDAGSGVWLTIDCSNLCACNPALQHLVHTGIVNIVRVFRFSRGCSAGEIAFVHGPISDHYYFIHIFGNRIQLNGQWLFLCLSAR